MFTIRFRTDLHRPDETVPIRSDRDGWTVDELRVNSGEQGALNADLKFVAHNNLYACGNSVFAPSPAANPSVTLVALALRSAKRRTE